MVDEFGTGARFVAAVGEAGDALGHHPSVSIGNGYVDLKVISDDAIYRDDEGNRTRRRGRVTQQDVDLGARRDHRDRRRPARSTPTRPQSASSNSASTRRTPRSSPRCGPPC
ncbi:MAG: hypothetical protein WKF83_10690 [Nocardioidaceae bacterium]